MAARRRRIECGDYEAKCLTAPRHNLQTAPAVGRADRGKAENRRSVASARHKNLNVYLRAALNYIRHHWHGDLSLAVSFWINLVVIGVAIVAAQLLIKRPFVDHPQHLFYATAFCFVTFRVVIYPWQAIGVLRSCERALSEYKNVIWIRSAQVITVLGISVVVMDGFDLTRTVIKLNQPEEVQASVQKIYSLTLRNSTTVQLQGSLDLGITRELRQFLEAHPGVTGIILNSDGGHVFEARGLAAVIIDRGLSTYSSTRCYSSCTIAFAGGSKRILGSKAELGFHRYKLGTVMPVIDVENELKKDLQFYKDRGIDADFLEQIVHTPDTSIWVPEIEELLRAGVVHSIDDAMFNN